MSRESIRSIAASRLASAVMRSDTGAIDHWQAVLISLEHRRVAE